MLNGIRNIALFIGLIGFSVVGNIAAAEDFDILDIVKKDLHQRVTADSNINTFTEPSNVTPNTSNNNEFIDFEPYMRDLQRRIKLNWNPPKDERSKKVVLVFKIAKDGKLLTCSVLKSSGLRSADKAALNAVKDSAPFRSLPAEYKYPSVDIQFTFDYNAFAPTNLPR